VNKVTLASIIVLEFYISEYATNWRMFWITVVKCLQRRSCSVPAKLAKYFPHTKQAKDIFIIFFILNIHLPLVKHMEHNITYQVNCPSVIESLVCYSNRKFFIVFTRALYMLVSCSFHHT